MAPVIIAAAKYLFYLPLRKRQYAVFCELTTQHREFQHIG